MQAYRRGPAHPFIEPWCVSFIFWTHAPLTARAMEVPQGMDDHAAIAVGRTPAVGRRDDDERRDGVPVRIGPIGRIPGWIGSTCTSWQTRLLLIRTAWSPL